MAQSSEVHRITESVTLDRVGGYTVRNCSLINARVIFILGFLVWIMLLLFPNLRYYQKVWISQGLIFKG